MRILFLAMLLSAPLPATAQTLEAPLPTDGMETTIHRLDNGLTIYLSPNHLEPRVAAQIAVRAGSKNDPSNSTGMAHYLEHMLFKGSTALGTLDYAKEKPHLDRIAALYEQLFGLTEEAQRAKVYKQIDAENIEATRLAVPNEIAKIYRLLGARGLNAYTSDEQTVYVNNIPANRLEAWAKLESDRFAAPIFRLFQTEIETVYEEKNRAMDNAERILDEALEKQLFKVHPYGQQTTLGSIEHLKNPSLAKMYAFYNTNYVPNNMAIALSGDFDRAETLKLLEEYFGSWKPTALPPPPSWPIPKPKGVERLEVKYEAEEKVTIAWLTVPHGHPDADAIEVMDMLMDNSASGLINLTLNQAQRVKNAGSGPSLRNDAGAWYLYAVPKQGQTLEEAESLLMEAVAKLKAGEFSEEDMKAIMTNFEISEKARLESNDARVGLLVSNFIWAEPWPLTVDHLARLKAVTKEQVLGAAKKYLGDDRVVAYRRNAKPELPRITKPQFTKIEVDASRQSAFFREIVNTPAKPLEPRWLEAGRDYTITELSEGRLFSSKNPVNDLFSLSWNFDFGRKRSRRLCAGMSLVSLSGAGALSADEYKKKLYALGTTQSYSCGEQGASISLSGLEKNLWPSLELMRRHFETPNTATDTLKKFVDVTLGGYQDNKRDPGTVHYALGELAQRGRESDVLQSLTEKELKALDEEELKEQVRDLLRYRRRVAYVGTRQPGELARLIDQRLPSYKAPPRYEPVLFVKPERSRVWFTHRDMVQARVGLFAADEILDPEHALDYSFFSSYMGGGMSAVLFQEIREARSLAYSAGGGYAPGRNKGDENQFYGALGCQADKTAEAGALLESLFHAPPMADKRFRETAAALEQGYRTNPIMFRAAPGALMAWEDQGISGGDPRPQRFARLLSYRPADMEAFTRRLKEKPFTLYVLSHRDRVDLEGLKKLGDFAEKQLSELFPY